MPPDLLLACMPRSGSTMLGSMLHVPPGQVFLLEPLIGHRTKLAPDDAEAVRGAGRWGLKEITQRNIETAIDELKPRQVLRLVRDLRHVAASFLEWIHDHGHPGRITLDEAADITLRAAAWQCAHNAIYPAISYEALVEMAFPAGVILTLTGWRLGRLDYSAAHWSPRRWEIARHPKPFSSASLALDRWGRDDACRDYVARVLEHPVARRYQTMFGYPTTL